jgi:hypothetical protein
MLEREGSFHGFPDITVTLLSRFYRIDILIKNLRSYQRLSCINDNAAAQFISNSI